MMIRKSTLPQREGDISGNNLMGARFGCGDHPPFRRRPGHLRLKSDWTSMISPDEWAIYCRAMEALRTAEIPFMLGGGFALAAFTGRWRDTKDIDFYLKPQDRDAAVKALSSAGFADYYSRLPYDRKWIYRSVQSDVIVDIIWSMANQRAQVDDLWFQRAGSLSLHGQRLLIIPPEEFMWCKLYILQRDHCDWTDIFNLLYAVGERLDWDHLLIRLEEDAALVKGVLTVYGWLCPRHFSRLPSSLCHKLQIARHAAPRRRPARNRIRLLDSRNWFAALLPSGKKLEV
jgi:hypothetical protein